MYGPVLFPWLKRPPKLRSVRLNRPCAIGVPVRNLSIRKCLTGARARHVNFTDICVRRNATAGHDADKVNIQSTFAGISAGYADQFTERPGYRAITSVGNLYATSSNDWDSRSPRNGLQHGPRRIGTRI